MALQAKKQVVGALNRIGIKAGDTVLVHSDSTLAMRLSKSASFSAASAFLKECF